MKEKIARLISSNSPLSKEEILNLIEIPPSPDLGDYAFPCFALAKHLKKNPIEIAKNLSVKIKSKDFEKIESNGAYLNFFIDRKNLTKSTLQKIQKEKAKFGSSNLGKGKTIVIDLSAPNIAKPFGVGHLRSTIIGNSISNICRHLGFKTIKINYLGDWGTQFGKLIQAYKLWGNEKELKTNPINHLQELYVRINKDDSQDEESRKWFKKLEDKDKEALRFWKLFKKVSISDFNKIYRQLNIKFDVISGESLYNDKMDEVISELEKKSLLVESNGAKIVNLEKYGLGVCLIKKSDGATLYATRDLTAAMDRSKTYNFYKMLYEVGAEQKLHFKQVFKVLELMGYGWAKNCIHIDHGLYLDSDGRKFSTRKGKTILMEDILDETKDLARVEILKRAKLQGKELENRASAIALAAIFYGDLKNFRSNDMIFDIDKFISFEGNTGPYLLYTYARARSILRKAKYKKSKFKIKEISDKEKNLVFELSKFPELIVHSYEGFAPNIIANYAYQISQMFNEFYHAVPVIGSDEEDFRLALVDSVSHVLKKSLNLLGIQTLEKM